jgi:hypothetical protein
MRVPTLAISAADPPLERDLALIGYRNSSIRETTATITKLSTTTGQPMRSKRVVLRASSASRRPASARADRWPW